MARTILGKRLDLRQFLLNGVEHPLASGCEVPELARISCELNLKHDELLTRSRSWMKSYERVSAAIRLAYGEEAG